MKEQNRTAKISVYLDNCVYNSPFDDQTCTEQFISTLLKEQPFDYTEWSREHFANIDIHEFNQRAIESDKNNPV